MTNRQVADRLLMSVHTVEAHLSTVYRLLGIRSRRELASALSADRVAARDSAARIRDSGTS
jgi:DNA-binding CsgD family transcriptional regulator